MKGYDYFLVDGAHVDMDIYIDLLQFKQQSHWTFGCSWAASLKAQTAIHLRKRHYWDWFLMDGPGRGLIESANHYNLKSPFRNLLPVVETRDSFQTCAIFFWYIRMFALIHTNYHKIYFRQCKQTKGQKTLESICFYWDNSQATFQKTRISQIYGDHQSPHDTQQKHLFVFDSRCTAGQNIRKSPGLTLWGQKRCFLVFRVCFRVLLSVLAGYFHHYGLDLRRHREAPALSPSVGNVKLMKILLKGKLSFQTLKTKNAKKMGPVQHRRTPQSKSMLGSGAKDYYFGPAVCPPCPANQNCHWKSQSSFPSNRTSWSNTRLALNLIEGCRLLRTCHAITVTLRTMQRCFTKHWSFTAHCGTQGLGIGKKVGIQSPHSSQPITDPLQSIPKHVITYQLGLPLVWPENYKILPSFPRASRGAARPVAWCRPSPALANKKPPHLRSRPQNNNSYWAHQLNLVPHQTTQRQRTTLRGAIQKHQELFERGILGKHV